MECRFLMPVFVAVLIVVGASTPAWAAQLYVSIDPDDESSPFNVRYQKTVFIEYPKDGLIRDQLGGRDWQVAGSADSSNPGVQDLMDQMNRNIHDSGSQASVSDLDVSYDIHLKPFDGHTSIDYNVILNGDISNYIITKDFRRALIDLGWRGLGAHDDVVIDGVEINMPISMLASHSPGTYELLAGTAAGDVLLQPIINADFILKLPMTDWHFLFDPTGVSFEAGTFGLSDEMAVSVWTLPEGCCHPLLIQIEREFEAVVTLDREYTIRSLQSEDNAVVRVIGFGTLDVIDGVEIVGTMPDPPDHRDSRYSPVFIIYGIAGLVAIAGVGFFLARRWFRKRQSVRHQ